MANLGHLEIRDLVPYHRKLRRCIAYCLHDNTKHIVNILPVVDMHIAVYVKLQKSANLHFYSLALTS